MMSLSGLALESVCWWITPSSWIENIYRLRPWESVRRERMGTGTKQVAGAIIASTLTTVWRIPADGIYRRNCP